MKLNEQKVKTIVDLFETTDLKDAYIAEIFGVTRESINHIRHGHRWSSVTGIKPKTKEPMKISGPRSNDFRQFITDQKDYKKKYYELLNTLKELTNVEE